MIARACMQAADMRNGMVNIRVGAMVSPWSGVTQTLTSQLACACTASALIIVLLFELPALAALSVRDAGGPTMLDEAMRAAEWAGGGCWPAQCQTLIALLACCLPVLHVA